MALTDRNDLGDQRFGQLQRYPDVLGQAVVQANGRDHLCELTGVFSANHSLPFDEVGFSLPIPPGYPYAMGRQRCVEVSPL
jgi:hypothetical protein